jgi:hypothetical protein
MTTIEHRYFLPKSSLALLLLLLQVLQQSPVVAFAPPPTAPRITQQQQSICLIGTNTRRRHASIIASIATVPKTSNYCASSSLAATSLSEQEEEITSNVAQDGDNSDTVTSLENSKTGQKITLIGTAHLSESSNVQVRSIVEKIKPDVVMVELDRSRLERIGLTEDELMPNLYTSEDIDPPLTQGDIDALENGPPFWRGFTEFCLDRFAEFARGSLTNMYNDMGESMGNEKDGMVGGGEFLAAITAAQNNDAGDDNSSSTKIILGDRSSMQTLKRAAELAIRSGNPIGVMGRLFSVNQEELDQMRDSILEEMGEDGDVDMKEFNVAMVERMKTDTQFRNRLFSRLEQEVPEFTQSFLVERDYIMAEVIRRETDAKHVVAVVGLAHVPGMTENLRAANFQ